MAIMEDAPHVVKAHHLGSSVSEHVGGRCPFERRVETAKHTPQPSDRECQALLRSKRRCVAVGLVEDVFRVNNSSHLDAIHGGVGFGPQHVLAQDRGEETTAKLA